MELFEDKSEKLCIPENESMLLVGKCGTRKTKTIICIDEFYPNDMSDVINGMLYNTVLDLVRFGKLLYRMLFVHPSLFQQLHGIKSFVT